LIMVRSRSKKSHQFNPIDNEADVARPPENLAGLLRSPSKEEREAACIAMANLSSKTTEEPLIKLVAERLIDSSLEVQLAAMHALYNLAEKNINSLLNCGVLEMLETLLSTHFVTQGVYANSTEEHLGQMLACEGLDLISHMCEVSGSVHSAISSSVLVGKCIEMLSVSWFALPVINLLTVLSEDNEELAVNLMSSWGAIQASNTPELHVQVAKAGLLLNVAAASNNFSCVHRDVIPVVSAAAVLDLNEEFERTVLPILNSEESHKSYEKWGVSVRAVKQALEILTNLFSEDLVSYEFLDASQTTHLLVVLNKIATGLPLETIGKLTELLMPQSDYLGLQCAALTCLQNIMINTSVVGELVSAKTVWGFYLILLQKFKILSQEVLDCDEELTELLQLVSSGLCVLLKNYLSQIEPLGTFNEGSGLMQAFIELVGSTDTIVKANALTVVGILAQEPHSLDTNAVICETILTACKTTQIEVLLEGLNCIFDIYPDERYDEVLKLAGAVQLLEAGFHELVKIVESIEDDDMREQGEVTVINLQNWLAEKAPLKYS